MPKLKKLALLFLSLQLLTFSLLPNIARADVESDQTASVTVPAQASDFPISISQVTSGNTFAPDQTIEYQISYGSDLSFSVANLKIETQWYQGTSEDGSNQDVANYVVDSASNAYNSTPPVVDTVNKKIDWTISSFPANTQNQTVNFKLKTNNSYTKNYTVTFNVAGRIYGPGATTPDKSISANYKYPSSNNSSTSLTPTLAPSISPTVTTPVVISPIEVRTISQNTTTIYVATSRNSRIRIQYGKTPNSLDQNVSSVGLSSETFLTLTKLSPATVYYFRVSSRDQNNVNQTSDIFTFKTSSAPAPQVDIGTLDITSADNSTSLLDNSGGNQEQPQTTQPVVSIPESTVFKFKFSLNSLSNISKVQAFIRNSNVLGISFPSQALADTEIGDLIEVSPRVWEGSIQTKQLTGNYELYARITDTKGNLTEQKIAKIKVTNKFTVLSANTQGPIEGARVLIYIYSQSAKKYFRIPSSNLSTGNPLFTDPDGKLNLVLPIGQYRADVTNLNYKDGIIYFKIKPDSNYPIVKLESEPKSLPLILRYFYRSLNDVFLYNTQLYAQILTGSVRFFNLVAAVILGCLVLLTLMAFSKRHHIPISSLASYFYYLLDHNGNQNNYVEGVIYDEKDNPIPSANVYLSDSESEEIISKSKTNRLGEFFFRRSVDKKDKYFLLAMCKGYRTTPLISYEAKTHIHLKITLSKEHEGLNLIENAQHILNGFLSMSFEVFGVLTLIFELLFIANFGLLRTAPFLAVSVFNLLIWTLYVHHHHRYQE